MAECRHGIDQRSCADCRIPPAYDWAGLWALAHPDDGLGPWIESVWGGRCRGCGELFDPGDLIRRYEDENGYLAICCGSLLTGSPDVGCKVGRAPVAVRRDTDQDGPATRPRVRTCRWFACYGGE